MPEQSERTHFHVVSGLAGFLPNSVHCLGEVSAREAAEMLRDEVDRAVDSAHESAGDCASEPEMCDACVALAEVEAVLADGDYRSGVCVLVDSWEYFEVSVAEGDAERCETREADV